MLTQNIHPFYRIYGLSDQKKHKWSLCLRQAAVHTIYQRSKKLQAETKTAADYRRSATKHHENMTLNHPQISEHQKERGQKSPSQHLFALNNTVAE